MKIIEKLKSFLIEDKGFAIENPDPKNPTHKGPKSGEFWKRSNGDPFQPKIWAEIIEVKNGWVRFGIVSMWETRLCGPLSDERMPLKDFIRIYEFWKNK